MATSLIADRTDRVIEKHRIERTTADTDIVFVSASGTAEEMIFGERFVVERDGRDVLLTHPQWSLMGAGRTREEALLSLLEEAEDLATELAAADPSTLSSEAARLREFVLRLR